jgi:DNA-binding transcriptional ArsR family regulator
MSEKVVLDMKSFKALSSDMRISILKTLDKNRCTITELSGHLDISKPALLKHIDDLIMAGLVSKEEKKRKWIYYDLTFKGRRILHPESVAIVVLLSVAVISFAVAIAGFLMYGLDSRHFNGLYSAGYQSSPPKGGGSNTLDAILPTGHPWLSIGIVFLVIFIVMMVCAFIVKKKYGSVSRF